ncbi:hypothetical protein ACJJTC_005522 [Scirpophaga incertulas]
MLKCFLIGITFIAVCSADVPVAPPAPPRVYCGEIPNQIYGCVGIPKVATPEITQKCAKSTNTCEKYTCVFRELGWLKDSKVDKARATSYFEDFGKQHAEWAPAVAHVKAACLSHDLPAQGVHLNCPAYDVMMCALAGFIRNAQPSQWSMAESCAYARQYAGACPVCPGDCFAPAVPAGSCNACLALPRTP